MIKVQVSTERHGTVVFIGNDEEVIRQLWTELLVRHGESVVVSLMLEEDPQVIRYRYTAVGHWRPLG